MPDILKAVKELGFPAGSVLKSALKLSPSLILDNALQFVNKIQEEADLDVISVNEYILEFAFVQNLGEHEALSYAIEAYNFSSQFFNMGPSKDYTIKAWAKNNKFGVGSA